MRMSNNFYHPWQAAAAKKIIEIFVPDSLFQTAVLKQTKRQ